MTLTSVAGKGNYVVVPDDGRSGRLAKADRAFANPGLRAVSRKGGMSEAKAEQPNCATSHATALPLTATTRAVAGELAPIDTRFEPFVSAICMRP
jgi:hypothetical protein